ncbi:MAG: bifunctional [glutamine synthetase] adenylyltransferase/[glutamine synthetase]-adenylyl-L-tyrosine phosphorylase [Acidimicrobiales bacterium]|nr:bifunctional [glutamine synthetase] adenylyltransferase/[glutamine synthetase]-adenylyl-L-tyrosine phosphorylase [Acidimicrobiales bacterium]
MAHPPVAELVERSADPPRVRAALERLAISRPDLVGVASDDPSLAASVVAVLAASRSLARVLEADPGAFEVLARPDQRELAPDPLGGWEHVVAWKRRELLRIASLDLTGAEPLDVIVRALSSMARDVLVAAHAEATRSFSPGDGLTVVAMGKLGGGELNYASDVDVLFVGRGDPERLERAARRLLERAGRCFRVDADLRPEGKDGPLVRSIAAYETYWSRWADPWERQALLKSAPVAGDPELGRRWVDAAHPVLWDGAFEADDLRYVRAMKVRAETDVRRRGAADRDVKRGPGGIRDVEFAVQLLQLVHGRVDEELRTPTTLDALEALGRGGYVDRSDAEVLAGSYRFLRRVEHGVQLEDERQTHVVPAERSQRRRLARVLGYRGTPEGGPTELFDRDLAAHRVRVRSLHERVWFRPLLASLSGAGPLGPEAAARRLAAFGFADLERTRQAVIELTRGLTRSSRMMQQLLPLLLDWLSASPDPDLGLLGLRRLASGEQRSRALASTFRDSPEAARHVALLLGTSRRLGDVLLANPDLIERLPHPDRLRTRSVDELVAGAEGALAWREEPDQRQRALQRWQHRHLLGVAARDVFGQASVDVVGADLSALAEATLEGALSTLRPEVPVAVVAFGRFGGAELGYASDLDLVFVHDGTSPDEIAEAERVASGLLRFVGGSTPAERIWAVDASLRPEGRNGPLARSLDGWRAYLARWASTWERQAYLRVRRVAGEPALAADLIDEIDHAVWARPFTEDEAREVRRRKVRIEQERLAPGEDPEFHLKLGRGSLSDVEFTVQLLQLRHGVPGARTLGALDALVEAGHLPADEADVLAESYRFCERTRNRSFLVVGPGDSLPLRPEQAAPLARSLGVTVGDLRAEYRRVTRRARRIVERRFYDQG